MYKICFSFLYLYFVLLIFYASYLSCFEKRLKILFLFVHAWHKQNVDLYWTNCVSTTALSYVLHYWLNCSCLISFPSIHTSLFMSYHIPFRLHFIDHISFYFLQSTVFLIHFIYHSPSHSHLPSLVALMALSFNLIVSFTFQPIPSLDINNLRVS